MSGPPPQRRIGGYGICRDPAGRVLLVRTSDRSVLPGTWTLPGGGVEHGEHPAEAAVRETAEETGLQAEVVRLVDVTAELIVQSPYAVHTDGVVYQLAVTGGRLRPESAGTTDQVRWVAPEQAATLPLSRFAAVGLGRPPPQQPGAAGVVVPPVRRTGRGQRFAAYGWVTDPAGRVLLTLIADGYPGAGRWHLPGGGTDFGEQPRDGLLRELMEETGQGGHVTDLRDVTHHHHPAALGPEGRPVDWHSVRAVFGVRVAEPTVPQVVDQGGSTAAAGWFTPAELAGLPLTDHTASVLAGRPVVPGSPDYRA